MKFAAMMALLGGLQAVWGQAPVITAVTNLQGDPKISPSDVVQVFGTWPADGARNFTVTVGGFPGRVGISWINRNVPVELDIEVPAEVPLGNTTIVISHLGASSNAFPITITAVDPVLSFDSFTAFLHLDGHAITPTSPATTGEVVSTFMTGLGVTNPPTPTSSSVGAFTPTAMTTTVTVAGKPAELRFAGLPPGGKAGSYQVSFTVPSDTPSGAQPVTVTIGGVSSNSQALFVGSAPLPPPPTVAAVVNGATFSAKSDLSPGSFFTVYASGLGDTDNLSAFPATQVNGISVLVAGKPAPIFHLIASQSQINALVPPDADMGASLSVVVQNQNGPSKSVAASGGAAGPGIFLKADPSNTTRRNAAATIASSAWLVIPASQAKALQLPNCAGLTPADLCGQPARVGDFVQMYVTGLGKATPNGDPNGAVLPTGKGAPIDGNPLYITVAVPSVTVGGVPAKVIFSGLAPGYSGLYQVDFQIPAGAPTGDNVPVEITMPRSVPDSATIAISN